MMVSILQASPEHQAVVHDIFREYLEWVCAEIMHEFDVPFDAHAILAHDMETLDIFQPPQGRLLLAYVDDVQRAARACARSATGWPSSNVCMCSPTHRRLGIGRAMVT